MAQKTTMGILASRPCPPDEECAFIAIIESIEMNFPEDWRSWEVYDWSFKELFGGELDPKIDSKLRFAIPTAVLARAFSPNSSSLSERRYRNIRHKLLRWPIGRALIYAPHHIMEKIHCPGRAYLSFMDTVKSIKNKLVNRRSASVELRVSQQSRSSSPAPAMSETERSDPSHSRKRLGSIRDSDSTPAKRIRPSQDQDQSNNEHVLISVLNQQMEMFNRLMANQCDQNNKIEKILSNAIHRNPLPTDGRSSLNESFDSLPDSTLQGDEEDDEQISHIPTDPPAHPKTTELPQASASTAPSAREIDLVNIISDAQRELVNLKTNLDYDFEPNTVEAKPKIASTDPYFLEQGIKCQRFGKEGWRSLKYVETKNQFQASPAFCALKVNPILANATPPWKSLALLEKFDLTLGAITHGLLQQRKIFKDMLEQLPPEEKVKMGQNFLNADSKFKEKSDDLLQYVCGRRAEVIEQRRQNYKPKNKVLADILQGIPPSEVHLFSDSVLVQAVNDCSNVEVQKFFPSSVRKRPFPRSGKGEKTRAGRTQATARNIPYKRGTNNK